jgi:hypothetical protein
MVYHYQHPLTDYHTQNIHQFEPQAYLQTNAIYCVPRTKF